MKNWISYLLLLFIVGGFWQCNAAGAGNEPTDSTERPPAENGNFTFRVEGMGAGAVRLVGILNDQQFLVDERSSDANGLVQFQKDEPYRQGIYFALLPNNANFQFMITEDQTFTMSTNINDLVGQMKVDGSLDNALFYDNIRYENAYQQQLAPLNEQRNTLDENSVAYQQVEASREALIEKRRTDLQEIFDAHPNSFFTTFKKAGQNPVHACMLILQIQI